MRGRKDPVKKNMDLFCKPKTFRDRKKDYHRKKAIEDEGYEVKRHEPYVREKFYYEDEGTDDFPDETDSREDSDYEER